MKHLASCSLVLLATFALVLIAGCGGDPVGDEKTKQQDSSDEHGDHDHGDHDHGDHDHGDHDHGDHEHGDHEDGKHHDKDHDKDHDGDHGEASASSDKVKTALAKLSDADRAAVEAQKICPVGGEALGSMGTPLKISVKEQDVWICCKGCESKLKAEPDKYLAKIKSK